MEKSIQVSVVDVFIQQKCYPSSVWTSRVRGSVVGLMGAAEKIIRMDGVGVDGRVWCDKVFDIGFDIGWFV